MTYTPREATAASGRSKSSVLGALKSGTINDTRNAHDGWQLEPVELHGLLPAASPARTLQRQLESAEEHVSRVEADLRLALAEARVSRVQAELADAQTPRDAWNSQPEAQLFDEEVVIKGVLDALPHGSAITFSADQLEVLFSCGGPILADTKAAATIIEGLAYTCGCSFALHGDTGTFTKNLSQTAASAQMNVPRQEALASGADVRSPIRLVPTDGNRQVNGSLAQPNFSPVLPVVEPSNELVFDCKTHSDGYRTTKEGPPNVRREPRKYQLYSVGNRDQSAKRISRGSLQIAILALTVGATTGAGAVLALVGHPSHQYTASLTARLPIIIQQAANLPAPEPAGNGRRKVSDETPEHAAPPWPVPLEAYASSPMNSPSSQIPGAPDHLGQATNRTSALDMPSSSAGAANEKMENARQTGRERYIRVTSVTHRFTQWQHRYRYAFHRHYRYAFHRHAIWRGYRYAFHSLRKGWI